MTLQPGRRLGPYEIIASIGAGGMGEVYRATDTRLDRTVAVKILPESLGRDPERRERFEREARAISTLNHPNICVLHDVGTEDDIDFLVMEYLEGETLGERLSKRSLGLTTALEYGVSIADALSQAHRSGVVHRDLKPSNVMLTASGIKLLDFGLAKLGIEDGEELEGVEEETRQKPLTGAGTLLGTVQYMAPEQLEGREADARADVFAFGALLYEMVTGRRAFEGKSQASLIGAIMNKEPAPMKELEPLTPAPLERVIRKCLAKDREERWQSAGDLRDALRWIADGEDDAQPAGSSKATGGSARWLIVAGAIAAALVTGMFWALATGGPERAQGVTHTLVPLEPHQAFTGGVTGVAPFAVSPDGTVLAYTVSEGTTRHLYLRDLNSFESRRVEASDGANAPFFSPDGQWVGFFGAGGLYKASSLGGPPIRIGDGPAVSYGADWSRDGTIVYSSLQSVFRVAAEGGSPELVWEPSDGVVTCPRFLSSTERIVLLRSVGAALALSLETGESSTVPALTDTRCVEWLANGYLIQHRRGSVWAGQFDPESLQWLGPTAPVIEDVYLSSTGFTFAAAAGNGALVYAAAREPGPMVWVDREGRATPTSTPAAQYQYPRLNRANDRAVARMGTDIAADLRVLNLVRGGSVRLGTGNFVAWGPDATTVTVSGSQDGFQLHRISVDDPSDVTRLHESGAGVNVPGAWSRDGSLFAFYRIEATSRDLWVLRADGTAEPFLTTEANERTPYPSPDGSRIAYVSDESGRDEVYVRNYPDTGKRWVLSTEGGREPVWSPDGTEVFYRNGRQMLAVDVRDDDALDRATPRVLFEELYGVNENGLTNYDVAQDGQRFLMVTDDQPTQMRIITNWGDEIERRLEN